MTAPDLAEIVEGTITLMLGLDPGEPASGEQPARCEIGASVQLAGEWHGAVVVSCDLPFGRRAAAAMFASEPDALSESDVTDALGELANMIAGNVKPLLPGAATISLPTVVRGADVQLGVVGARAIVGIVYRGTDSELAVRIFERTVSGGGAA
jgi:chemotaxis protein CheX